LHHLLRNYEWSIPADYRWTLEPRSLGEPVDGLRTQLRRVTVSPPAPDDGE
jgi:hypothetical protein